MVSCNPAAGVVQGHEVGGHLSRNMLFQRKPADVSLSTTGNKGSVLRNTSSQGERPRVRLGVRDRRQVGFWGQRGTGWRRTNRTQSRARTERVWPGSGRTESLRAGALQCHLDALSSAPWRFHNLSHLRSSEPEQQPLTPGLRRLWWFRVSFLTHRWVLRTTERG